MTSQNICSTIEKVIKVMLLLAQRVPQILEFLREVANVFAECGE